MTFFAKNTSKKAFLSGRNALTRGMLGLLLLSLGLWGCVDRDFDEPPIEDLPNVEANATIAELKALHAIGQPAVEVQEDIIIQGIVVGSDESGNLFKELILQDSTGGIQVRVDATDLFNDFPVGRRVYVRCRGLYLGDFNGAPQLNGGPDARIAELLIDSVLIGGERGLEVLPRVVTLDELDDDLIHTLVQLDGLQFVDTASTYADTEDREDRNLDMENCEGGILILRSSGFADFAPVNVPNGRGAITGIFSVFGDDQQLRIRDTSDVQFNGPRCGGGTGNEQLLTLQELRALYTGSDTPVPDERKIRGVVISDRSTDHTDGANLYVQDPSAGIVLRFTGSHSLDLGQEVEVVVSNGLLTRFNGLLQVQGIDPAGAVVIGEDMMPSPRVATVQEVLNHAGEWESTLVEIRDATFSGGSTFEGSLTVSDGTGSMPHFTRPQATFSGASVPADPVDMKAIISQFNGPQLLIRNLADVGGSGPDPGGPDTLNVLIEDFSQGIDGQDIDYPGWTNVALDGSRKWRTEEFSGNQFAQATAFQDNSPAMETWLITPPINLDSGPKTLTFESAQAFWVHDGLQVFLSTDFDGENVAAATWTELSCTLAGSSQDNYDWVDSGPVDLSAFSGIGYIAFRYEGAGGSQTTTYRIDNLRIE